MSRPALLAFAALAGGGFACGDPAAPPRVGVYAFAVAGDSSLVFRWPQARLPVRYYAKAEGNLPDLTSRGILRWEAQFLYGEFQSVLVGDSTAADVLVEFESGPPPPAPPDTTSVVFSCQGETRFTIDRTDGFAIDSTRIRVILRWSGGFSPGEITACLDRVATHEIGHTLGLFNALHEGTDPEDIMFGSPRVYTPSRSDRATVQVLYHTAPTVAPPTR